jgi:hypothetical protein
MHGSEEILLNSFYFSKIQKTFNLSKRNKPLIKNLSPKMNFAIFSTFVLKIIEIDYFKKWLFANMNVQFENQGI